MIGIVFSFGTEIVEVRVVESQMLFRTSQFQQWADISGIKLDKSGVIKEFPDLKDDEYWQQKARERFKEKIKSMENEEQRIKYIIEDLTKYGYKPLYMQKSGFRPIKL